MANITSSSYTQITSKNIGSTDYGSITLRIYAKLNSQNIANNTSTVGTKLTVKLSTGTANSSGCSYSLTGATSKSKQTLNMTTTEKTLLTGTYTFTHNNDGTSGSKTIKSSYDIYSHSGSFSTTITTPDIPRKAEITSAPNFTDEDNPTITYSNKAGNSVSSLQARIENAAGTATYVDYRDISKTGTSYTFNFTAEEKTALWNASANSNTLEVKFVIRTIIGSTPYRSTLNRTLTIVNAEPDIQVTTAETNQSVISLIGSSVQSAIKNASQIQVTPTYIQSYNGATINNVRFASGTNIIVDAESPYEATVIPLENNIVATVTDSRGNTATDTKTFTLIDYEKISFNSFSFKRINPTSSDIRLDADIKYYQQTFGSTPNTPTVRWAITQNDTTTWTTLTVGTDYTIDTQNNKIEIDTTLTNALVYTEQAVFTLEVSDLLSSFSDTKTVLVGIPTFEAGEHDFQVNGDLYVADTTRQNIVNILEEINTLKSKKCAITARMSANYTLTTSGTIYNLTINTRLENVGDLLSVENGGIKIGAGVSRVMVSGQIYWYTNVGTTDDSIGYIIRDRSGSTTQFIVHNQRFTNNYEHMTLPTKLMYVEEGDIIKLCARSSTNGTVIQGTYDDATFLTVQVID